MDSKREKPKVSGLVRNRCAFFESERKKNQMSWEDVSARQSGSGHNVLERQVLSAEQAMPENLSKAMRMPQALSKAQRMPQYSSPGQRMSQSSSTELRAAEDSSTEQRMPQVLSTAQIMPQGLSTEQRTPQNSSTELRAPQGSSTEQRTPQVFSIDLRTFKVLNIEPSISQHDSTEQQINRLVERIPRKLQGSENISLKQLSAALDSVEPPSALLLPAAQSITHSSNSEHNIPQGEQQNIPQTSQLNRRQRSAPFNGVWYRHSGEPEVDDIPNYDNCCFKDAQNDSDVLSCLGPHHITHMWVEGQHVESLQVIAPKVTHLRIWRISNVSQLSSLTSLKGLKSLDLSGNHLPCGLPTIIGQLSTLEELHLDRCSLSGLPHSMSELKYLKSLSLRCNQYSGGLPAVVGTLSSLEELNLRECNLNSLPTSLSSLGKLKKLNLSINNFSGGLPDVIGSLPSLTELHLESCKLRELPVSFGKLVSLEYLYIDGNHFKSLPPAVKHLKNLLKLSISKNGNLEALDSVITSLDNLESLVIAQCPSLTIPPQNVIIQGIFAIKQYYKDLEKGKGRNLPAATVCVIGKSKSGKISLIQTLQQNKRIVTGSQSRGGDVSTKVFKFEEVEVDGTKLRFIDFGGQEVYHLAYRLTLRENCVPIIVVNMELYAQFVEERKDREAVRRLYFDWMAHLYLAQPKLPAPKLVLTHKDKFSTDKFKELADRFVANSTDVRDAILLDEHQRNHREFTQITHLAKSTHLFESDQIFEIGLEYNNHTFDTLKSQLLEHCMQHVMHVPKIWEDIEDTIQSLLSSFSLFEDLLS